MKIDVLQQPEQDIFQHRKRYVLWFIFFFVTAFLGIAVGVYAIYFDSLHIKHLDDLALGILLTASLGITIYGNKLQKYKRLFPPQQEKLANLRTRYSVIDTYCKGVERLGRRFVRAEYEACEEYAEKHSALPFV
ncbi:hypothetical protein [Desulfogranum japonicum]|uniref:hypothetical protein n=1 Tax=Desulfogranum japonicum TaxID=231447 RepID=UPI0003FE5B69|nr:hypothetical protein [Desulfogranum japonicum]